HRGADGGRQEHAGAAAAAAFRRRSRERPARRPRRPEPAARVAPPERRAGAAGSVPVLAHHPRERGVRPGRRRRRRRGRRGRLGRRGGGPRPRPRRHAARPRDRGGRARHHALRRPEAARDAGPRPRRRSTCARARRRPLQRRRGHRARHPRSPARLPARAHHHPRGPSPDDREGGRSDRRAGRGPRRRPRRSRVPARARRRLRRSFPPAGARGRAGGDLTGDGEQIGKAYDSRLIRRLWAYVQPYRGVAWLTLLLSAVQQALSLAQPYLLKIGIDRYVEPRDMAGLSRLALWFVAAIAGEFLAFYGQQYLTMVVAQRSLADLRGAVFERLQRFPMRFFDRNPVGKVVSRVTTDVDVLSEMFAAGARSIALDGLELPGLVAFMLWIDWRLALASLVLLPPMTFAIDFFRRMARRTYREIRERIARINAYLQESISGMAVIALSAREGRCYAEFEELNAAHRDANQLSNKLEAALFSIVDSVSTVSVAAMLLEGARLRQVGALEIGTVLAFIQYINQFFVPIRDFSSKYAVMQSSMTAAERIFGLLDEEVEPETAASRRPPAARGEIVFDHVWFASRGEDWVLRDVSFRIAPGERIAIVGATGSGKTTIIKLIERLYDVQRGRVLVDGMDVRDWERRALRRRTAVVLQDVFLFNGSVADNLTLGRPDISRERLEAAARHPHA